MCKSIAEGYERCTTDILEQHESIAETKHKETLALMDEKDRVPTEFANQREESKVREEVERSALNSAAVLKADREVERSLKVVTKRQMELLEGFRRKSPKEILEESSPEYRKMQRFHARVPEGQIKTNLESKMRKEEEKLRENMKNHSQVAIINGYYLSSEIKRCNTAIRKQDEALAQEIDKGMERSKYARTPAYREASEKYKETPQASTLAEKAAKLKRDASVASSAEMKDLKRAENFAHDDYMNSVYENGDSISEDNQGDPRLKKAYDEARERHTAAVRRKNAYSTYHSSNAYYKSRQAGKPLTKTRITDPESGRAYAIVMSREEMTQEVNAAYRAHEGRGEYLPFDGKAYINEHKLMTHDDPRVNELTTKSIRLSMKHLRVTPPTGDRIKSLRRPMFV